MEKIVWYIVIPLITLMSYSIAVSSLFQTGRSRLNQMIRNRAVLGMVINYSRIFLILSIILYVITLGEGFENFDLGTLSLSSYFNNFFRTFEYFFGWVLLYWILNIFIASWILSTLIIAIKKLVLSRN